MASAQETIITSSEGVELLVVQIVMLVLAITSYILRVIVKCRRHDTFGHDDTLITLSVVFLIAMQILVWESRSVVEATSTSPGGQVISRINPPTILFWTIIATSQLSILFLYRYVCSGWCWAKAYLGMSAGLIISGWIAFTVCDSILLTIIKLNLESPAVAPLIRGNVAYQTATFVLEPLCICLSLGMQCCRLHHIRRKIVAKPWVILVPVCSAIAFATGLLRLAYFRSQDVVSEIIWLHVHLGVTILSASVPVYTGLENMCCGQAEDAQDEIALWARNFERHDAQRISPVDTEDGLYKKLEPQAMQAISPTPSRRPSISSIVAPVVRRLSDVSNWTPQARRPSITESLHGLTREIVIEPHEAGQQRLGTDFIPKRSSSKAERGTKRLMFEG